jgi:hypothetical protein
MADADGFDLRRKAAQELVVDVLVHDRAAAGRALLALVAVGRGDHGVDRLVEVAVAVDQDAVLAAHLGDQPLHPDLALLRLRGLFEDPQADVAAAGERDEARQPVLHHGAADRTAWPGDEVQHLLGQAAFMHQLDPHRGDRRRLAGGLQHHGVAGQQRCGGHAGHDGEREVPRRDDRADPERDVDHLVAFAGDRRQRLRRGHAQHLAGVVFEEVDRFGGVGVGLGPGLADFVAQQRREQVLALAQPLGGVEEDADAVVHVGVGPGREGGVRLFDGDLGFRSRQLRILADAARDFARIEVLEGLAALHRLTADPARPGAAQHVLGDGLQRLLEGLLFVVAGKIGERFVAEGGQVHGQILSSVGKAARMRRRAA